MNENATLNLCREVFLRLHFNFVVDARLPRFEAFAYVLPHLDELTHVLIRVLLEFGFGLPSFILQKSAG